MDKLKKTDKSRTKPTR